ncbi:MAG: energy transducer TonB [Bacteroidales bacterium]
MEEKKTKKANLDTKRITFLLVGFIVILGLVYASFELFASENKSEVYTGTSDDIVEIMEETTPDVEKAPPANPVKIQQVFVLKQVDRYVNTDLSGMFPDVIIEEEIPTYEPVEIVMVEKVDEPPVYFSEVMPEFIGGKEALYSFLKKELVYPENARNNGIYGTVLIEFIVEKDGSVSHVKAAVSLFPECDAEAIRVVSNLPKWNPGKINGKPVRCYFSLPIRFTLQ